MLLFLFGSSGDHSVTVVVLVPQEITMLLFLWFLMCHSVTVVVFVSQEMLSVWFVR